MSASVMGQGRRSPDRAQRRAWVDLVVGKIGKSKGRPIDCTARPPMQGPAWTRRICWSRCTGYLQRMRELAGVRPDPANVPRDENAYLRTLSPLRQI